MPYDAEGRLCDADGKPLVEGGFYWALPCYDVDAPGDTYEQSSSHWSNQQQPARFAGFTPGGDERWEWIATEVDDWPAIWIGKRIDAPGR